MVRAKIFQHGGSQAVRLPKAFRFVGTEVAVLRSGSSIMLAPVRHSLGDSLRSMLSRHAGVGFAARDQPTRKQKRSRLRCEDWG
ncbi:MAG: antitoxin [Chthoniobacterales bacterium]